MKNFPAYGTILRISWNNLCYTAYSVVVLLVEENAECIHWISDSFETALHKVCAHSHNIKIAELLIDKGANVNAVYVANTSFEAIANIHYS